MIIKGDKIKLVKKIIGFDKVGNIFEITGVDDNGLISFKCDYGTGCMSYSEFEKYFEKVEEQKKGEWGNWVSSGATYSDPFDNEERTLCYEVRDNDKKVQVRSGDFKAEATCCDDDEFDFDKGRELAVRRLIAKIISACVENYAKEL